MEGKVLAGVVARGDARLKVDQGTPPLTVGMPLGFAWTRSPRVDNFRVCLVFDVIRQRVVLFARRSVRTRGNGRGRWTGRRTPTAMVGAFVKTKIIALEETGANYFSRDRGL